MLLYIFFTYTIRCCHNLISRPTHNDSDDDEDGQYDDIESPHTEDMQMTSSGVGQVRKKTLLLLWF